MRHVVTLLVAAITFMWIIQNLAYERKIEKLTAKINEASEALDAKDTRYQRLISEVEKRDASWSEFVEADRARVLADVNNSLMRLSKMLGKPEMKLAYDEAVDGMGVFGFNTTIPVEATE